MFCFKGFKKVGGTEGMNEETMEKEPKPRSLFGLCSDNENVYIFGGQTKSDAGTQFLNDLWMINGIYYGIYFLMICFVKLNQYYST